MSRHMTNGDGCGASHRLRVAVVTPWDVRSRTSWSGVIRPMVEALGKRFDVIPVETGRVRDALVDRGLTRIINGRWGSYLPGQALVTSIKRGRQLTKRLTSIEPDVVLALAASQDIAFLKRGVPVVQVSDTTLEAIVDYYPMFTGLNPLALWQARVLSRRSARRTSMFLAATEWAGQHLVDDDGIAPDRIVVAPFGPAVEPLGEIDRRQGPHSPFRLLMVSSDWHRKGGPDVIRAFQEARKHGVNITLTIVGDAPSPLPVGVTHVPRVPHSQMGSLYTEHDALIELPVSSAAGVVLTDAAAYGLPVIARDTGGVGSIVQDGKSGFLVGKGRAAASDAICRLAAADCKSTYVTMSQAARDASSDLNWSVWLGRASFCLQSVSRPIARVGDASLPCLRWRRSHN